MENDCQSFRPGHQAHWIHVGQLGKKPWGSRPGVVSGYADLVCTVDYLLENGSVRVYHHRELPLVVGSPVRVHEELHALDTGRGWVNVEVMAGGLGKVPPPGDPAAWLAAHGADVAVTDLGTGTAVTPPRGPAREQTRE